MDYRIREAIVKVNSHLSDLPNLQLMAASFNLSVSRFQHLFKKEIGVSFTQYVKQQRLRKARKLLEATHLRIKEIRAQIGECNEKKFLQNFKKTYGVTPTEYRKNFHNNRKSQ